jgi:hypothetical protein
MFARQSPALVSPARTGEPTWRALLEAFEGKSDRPPPWLRVSDLQIWLAERVKNLTNGAQTPTTAVPFERFTNPVVYQVANPPG